MEDTAQMNTAVEGNKDEPTIVNATRVQQTARLKVNTAWKFALQVMLSIMLVLSGAALLLVKVRRTLPRSLHSIASVMGFLAGSKMCNHDENVIPSGSEYLSGKELNKLFRGRQFSLGWWKSGKTRTADIAAGGEDEAVGEVAIPQNFVVEPTETERFGIDMEGPMVACEIAA